MSDYQKKYFNICMLVMSILGYLGSQAILYFGYYSSSNQARLLLIVSGCCAFVGIVAVYTQWTFSTELWAGTELVKFQDEKWEPEQKQMDEEGNEK